MRARGELTRTTAAKNSGVNSSQNCMSVYMFKLLQKTTAGRVCGTYTLLHGTLQGLPGQSEPLNTLDTASMTAATARSIKVMNTTMQVAPTLRCSCLCVC